MNSQAYYLRQYQTRQRRRLTVPLAVAPSVPMVRPSVLLWAAVGALASVLAGNVALFAVALWGGL